MKLYSKIMYVFCVLINVLIRIFTQLVRKTNAVLIFRLADFIHSIYFLYYQYFVYCIYNICMYTGIYIYIYIYI